MASGIRFTQEEIDEYKLYVRSIENLGGGVLLLTLVDGKEYHLHGIGDFQMSKLFDLAKAGPEDEYEGFKNYYYSEVMNWVSDEQDPERHGVADEKTAKDMDSSDDVPSPAY